jgi:hypothetical protein
MVEGAFVDGIENVDGVVEDCAVLVGAVNSPQAHGCFFRRTVPAYYHYI